MIAIEARLGIALVAGLFGVWLAVRTDAPPAVIALPEPPALTTQHQVAYESAPPVTIEEMLAEQAREHAFVRACVAGGGRACCGQGGCCPGRTQTRATYEALMTRLTGEPFDMWGSLMSP